MRIRKNDVGKLFVVQFWDHSQGAGEAIYTEACGWLIRADRKQVVLRPWRTPKDDISNAGSDDYAILRSTIETMERR